MRSIAVLALLALPCVADDADRLLSVDHYVGVRSTVPAIAGQIAPIYVREVALTRTLTRSSQLNDRVVLFIHGAGTPAEVAFDVPYRDYSWMGYLARAGFDVFAMDMTGYGRSLRPPQMNDPCNLSQLQQTALRLTPCPATYAMNMTTIGSDWNDIGGVVDHIRSMRRVEKVSLVGWSLGGPRAGGFAARNPDKVNKLVLLSPAYGRTGRADPPAQVPSNGTVFNTQSRAEFDANWDRQLGCPDQYDPVARETVWSKMLESDPVGATWGTGVRRAPQTSSWGWNQAVVSKVQIPALLFAASQDKQVSPERVRELHTDLGSKEKVLVDLACSSHNALWERNHLLMFKASLDWLSQGSVNGAKEGVVKLGY